MSDASAVAIAAKWIGNALIQEGRYLYGVEDRVGSLQRELECMQELLQEVDANPYIIRHDGQLRIFTRQIRELAFRAEDAIETYLVDVGFKIYGKNPVLKLACFLSHSYPVHMLRKEIDAIQGEIEEAKKRFAEYRELVPKTCLVQENNIGSSFFTPIQENYLNPNDEFVVGIEDEITLLVKRLTNPDDDFKVLAIVGTGGAGKTTLATQLYHHKEVRRWFSHKAFVCVSQNWTRIDLLSRIFYQLKGDKEDIHSSDENALVKSIHDFMKGKKCLVVLDDIWKKKAWDDIYHIFPPTNDFRVILTTRIEEVSLYPEKKCIPHEPKLLTDDQKWELFCKGAVEGREGIENNVEFEKLGKQMLEKFQGLPLAVVTLAGILRSKQRLHEWEGVSKACSDYILRERGGPAYGVVEDMLELSYLDLPTHLQQCFLYLAVIPEDMDFSSEQLTQLWIAEGYISYDQQMGSETLEDAALRLLNELAQRYVLQVMKRNVEGEIERFRLHDLMREFCIKKAAEYHYLETVTSTSYVRRLYHPRQISIFSREYCLEENHHLRTLCYFGGWDKGGFIRKLESIHKELKLLRVLIISGCANEALPNEIGNLIHLTYLSLVNTAIVELPKSLRNLRNLLYLEFDHGNVIPNNLVRKMENLRQLDLPCIPSTTRTLGLSSERHKNLQTLRCSAGRWMIKDLPTLSPTVINLQIYHFTGETEEMEAIYQCLSILKGSLHTFTLRFDSTSWVTRHKSDILEKLTDFQRLWGLDLHARLKTNSNIQFPPNLVSLSLLQSEIREDVDLMEVLGQLCKLKCLCLLRDSYLGTQLSCTGTAFPQLQELYLDRLLNLQEWRMEGSSMNRLKRLEIIYCPDLKKLPERIRSIKTLKELVIRKMPDEFCRRLGQHDFDYGGSNLKGEDLFIIQHIPSIQFYWRG